VNPRGSDGYGERFYTAVVEGWGTADLDDFLAPIDALVHDGLADPARLAVTGYSYGGFMACWLTARTDRFAAAVAGGSVTNQLSLFGSSDLGYFLGALEIGGRPGDEAKALHEHSPITYVGDVTAPTLVLHGERDDRCPIEQAEQWFAALRAREVPTRLVRYPGASHLFIALGRPSHRLDYNRRVVAWLNEHVGVS
jgi:dipeptidyl aminopeptidase/acylaminoacyl peptidase